MHGSDVARDDPPTPGRAIARRAFHPALRRAVRAARGRTSRTSGAPSHCAGFRLIARRKLAFGSDPVPVCVDFTCASDVCASPDSSSSINGGSRRSMRPSSTLPTSHDPVVIAQPVRVGEPLCAGACCASSASASLRTPAPSQASSLAGSGDSGPAIQVVRRQILSRPALLARGRLNSPSSRCAIAWSDAFLRAETSPLSASMDSDHK